MNDSRGIFWLSSYLKSGNTWFRIFLANLINLSSNEKQPINLNELNDFINDEITTSRKWVNTICGFDTKMLTDDAVDALLPAIYADYHAQQTEVTYHKNHRAYTYVNDQPLMPLDKCLGAIYFIRNPLDVAISLANHFNFSIDDAIDMMGDKSYELRYFPLRQHLFSWSMHVDSWTRLNASNLMVLRYEDMVKQPLETFTKAVHFLKLNVSSDLIQQAIVYSAFEKLQQFENNIGFIDKPPTVKNFFRKGVVDDWRSTLTENQIQKIMLDHKDVMQRFGYITSQGR